MAISGIGLLWAGYRHRANNVKALKENENIGEHALKYNQQKNCLISNSKSV